MKIKTFKDINYLNENGYVTVHQANKIFSDHNSWLKVQRNKLDDALLFTVLFPNRQRRYAKNIIIIEQQYQEILPETVLIKDLDIQMEIEVFNKKEIEELAKKYPIDNAPDKVKFLMGE